MLGFDFRIQNFPLGLAQEKKSDCRYYSQKYSLKIFNKNSRITASTFFGFRPKNPKKRFFRNFQKIVEIVNRKFSDGNPENNVSLSNVGWEHFLPQGF